jgi:hypothetical protein
LVVGGESEEILDEVFIYRVVPFVDMINNASDLFYKFNRCKSYGIGASSVKGFSADFAKPLRGAIIGKIAEDVFMPNIKYKLYAGHQVVYGRKCQGLKIWEELNFEYSYVRDGKFQPSMAYQGADVYYGERRLVLLSPLSVRIVEDPIFHRVINEVSKNENIFYSTP